MLGTLICYRIKKNVRQILFFLCGFIKRRYGTNVYTLRENISLIPDENNRLEQELKTKNSPTPPPHNDRQSGSVFCTANR